MLNSTLKLVVTHYLPCGLQVAEQGEQVLRGLGPLHMLLVLLRVQGVHGVLIKVLQVALHLEITVIVVVDHEYIVTIKAWNEK